MGREWQIDDSVDYTTDGWWMLRTEVTDSMTIMMKTVGLEDIYPIQE